MGLYILDSHGDLYVEGSMIIKETREHREVYKRFSSEAEAEAYMRSLIDKGKPKHTPEEYRQMNGKHKKSHRLKNSKGNVNYWSWWEGYEETNRAKAEELKDFLWSLEKIENENLDTGIAEKFITDLQKREEFKSNPQGYEFEFMLDYHYCRPR